MTKNLHLLYTLVSLSPGNIFFCLDESMLSVTFNTQIHIL
jgi:hypothetical protein